MAIQCLKIGLTGGIATGKSSVGAILKKNGAVLIEADKISRKIVEPDSKAIKLIAGAFGKDFINRDGSLNRAKLSRTIFNNSEKRELLNNILHPIILDKIWKEIEKIEKAEKSCLIVVDIPLLFECGLQKNFDINIVVTAEMETRIKRIMKRDNISREEAQKKITAQLPCSKKIKLADYVIDNSGKIEELEYKTVAILKKLQDKFKDIKHF